jgi:predicted outer membrane repeat protein
MKGHMVKFIQNQAFFSAGAIFVTTFSYFDLSETEFTGNYAPENSAVEVL